MSSPIIKVENVSKKFLIGHQTGERYTALRDVISNNAKSFLRKTSGLLRGKMGNSQTTVEEFWALKDISLDIRQGDRVGVIGRNGAGKSTFLKVLSRITEPTSGRITIKGRVASLLEVGTGFHPELTGRENIFLNGAILGMSRAEIRKKFDEIVAFAETEKFLDTPVKRYSSGMYVRLAFAVAAHLEPEVLIVDEVLAVGDAQFQKKCLGKMEDVSKNQGRTVLFVSHNTGVISQLCNHTVWLNQGQVMKMGLTEDILRDYIQFLGGTGSNTFQRKGDNPNQIMEMEMFQKNVQTSTFLFKDEVEVRMKIAVEGNLETINVGLAVLSNLKQKIFTSHFDLTGHTQQANGQYIISCRIPSSTLVPGWYSVDAAIFRGGTQVYDYLKDVCPFEVVDSGFEMSGYSDFGFVNVPCKWQLENS